MSDSEDSTVTYTAVPRPFADLPDIGSSGVDGPPVMPKDPYAYVFMPPEDEILLAEEQPLPAAVSPIADSPGYVPESDPEEDLEEDDDEDPEEDPADYPANGGDDGDDEDELSNDDEDEDVDQAPSAEEPESFETDESATTPPPPYLAYRVAKLLAIPTLPPSPLSPWSSPLPQIPSPPLPPILSPLPLSPPLPISSPSLPASPIYPLGCRAAMIWLRAEAPFTSYSPLPHIILSHTRPDTPSSGTPPLHLLSTDRRADRPEVTLPPRKRLSIALGLRYEVGESSSAPTARPPRGFRVDYGFVATIEREIMRDLERDVGYRITDTWDEMPVDMLGAPATDDTEGYVFTYSGGSTAGSNYRATGSRPQETSGDYRDAGDRPQETGAVHRGTETAEETLDSDDRL
ncbi:hypothetical protein Tco_1285831 [Tanacetum coccineum]